MESITTLMQVWFDQKEAAVVVADRTEPKGVRGINDANISSSIVISREVLVQL